MENLTTEQIEMELKRRQNQENFIKYFDDGAVETINKKWEKDYAKLLNFCKKNNINPLIYNVGADWGNHLATGIKEFHIEMETMKQERNFTDEQIINEMDTLYGQKEFAGGSESDIYQIVKENFNNKPTAKKMEKKK